MTNKLIKDMDDETWRRFIAFCKLNDTKVNDELKGILETFLHKNLKEIIKEDSSKDARKQTNAPRKLEGVKK